MFTLIFVRTNTYTKLFKIINNKFELILYLYVQIRTNFFLGGENRGHHQPHHSTATVRAQSPSKSCIT
jgi:hypothetical protein